MTEAGWAAFLRYAQQAGSPFKRYSRPSLKQWTTQYKAITGFEYLFFQPLSLPMVITDVHTFVGGPVSSFWLHGRDDGPAGSRAAGRPARRQYAEMIEFEVSGRNML